MATILTKSAQAVQDVLMQHGLSSQVVELSASTRSAQEAADAIGCTVAQIIKSLIFRTHDSNRPILVLVSGVNRVNEQKIAEHVGEQLLKADADFVKEVTGFAIGGVPPVGHAQPVTTFIDQDLLQYDELWAAAGTPHAVFKLTPNDLRVLTKGAVIQVK